MLCIYVHDTVQQLASYSGIILKSLRLIETRVKYRKFSYYYQLRVKKQLVLVFLKAKKIFQCLKKRQKNWLNLKNKVTVSVVKYFQLIDCKRVAKLKTE